jgi:hypothetical protein
MRGCGALTLASRWVGADCLAAMEEGPAVVTFAGYNQLKGVIIAACTMRFVSEASMVPALQSRPL